MEFIKEEAALIESYLDEQRAKGNHWVAYDMGIQRLASEDLVCFAAVYDVKEYCYQNSKGKDKYTFCTIDKMQQQLEIAIRKTFRNRKLK